MNRPQLRVTVAAPGYTPCRICRWARAIAAGRCHTCDVYRRRTGRERPEHLVVAHGRRLTNNPNP